jgi:hypothetical protein
MARLPVRARTRAKTRARATACPAARACWRAPAPPDLVLPGPAPPRAAAVAHGLPLVGRPGQCLDYEDQRQGERREHHGEAEGQQPQRQPRAHPPQRPQRHGTQHERRQVHLGQCLPQRGEQDGQRLAAPLDAQKVAQLPGGDDDGRGGDEAGDDRVGHQVRQPAEPEQAQAQQHHPRERREHQRAFEQRLARQPGLPERGRGSSEMTATGPTESVRLVPKIA